MVSAQSSSVRRMGITRRKDSEVSFIRIKKKIGTNLKKTAVRNKEDFMRQRKYSGRYESDLLLLKRAPCYIVKGINCDFSIGHW